MQRPEFNPELVGVDVVTTYLPSHSKPEEDQYTFAYTITISNPGSVPATGQDVEQTPSTQTSPGPQGLPHAPQ